MYFSKFGSKKDENALEYDLEFKRWKVWAFMKLRSTSNKEELVVVGLDFTNIRNKQSCSVKYFYTFVKAFAVFWKSFKAEGVLKNNSEIGSKQFFRDEKFSRNYFTVWQKWDVVGRKGWGVSGCSERLIVFLFLQKKLNLHHTSRWAKH